MGAQLKDEIQAMRDQFNIMYKTISDGQEYQNNFYDSTVRVSAIPWQWSDTMIACEDCYRTWHDWFMWIESFTCDAECSSHSQGGLNGCMWRVDDAYFDLELRTDGEEYIRWMMSPPP